MVNSSSDVDPTPLAAVVRRPGEGRQIPRTSVLLKAEGRHSGGTLTVYEATLDPAWPVHPSISTGPGTSPSTSWRAK